MTKKEDRLIDTEEGTMGWCNVEKIYRPITDFQKNIRSSTGFDYRCRYCNHKRTLNPTYRDEERIVSNQILENLGYDTSYDVHKQFLIRHKL